ncbi:MAG: type II secretion system protein [Deltaproteobacteria bacterium]|nr:type II secretion system protein [Deltaproteobacteria bacterium]
MPLKLNHDNQPNCRSAQGFSLLELMLVITVIGLLFTVILPRMRSGANNAKLNLARQQATEIGIAVMRWVNNENSRYRPNTSSSDLGRFLMAPSRPLVGHYTGSPLFKGVARVMAPAQAPRNPFNRKSYFAAENDDPAHIPSRQPGLLYLASTLYSPPIIGGHKNTYRYYCFLISRGQQQWFANMNNRTVTGVRNGVYIGQERVSQ